MNSVVAAGETEAGERQRPPKLYVVVLGHFPRGLACAQGVHAAIAWGAAHDHKAMLTAKVVTLSAGTVSEITRLLAELEDKNLRVTGFYEPDFAYQLTAFAVEDSTAARVVLNDLPKL